MNRIIRRTDENGAIQYLRLSKQAFSGFDQMPIFSTIHFQWTNSRSCAFRFNHKNYGLNHRKEKVHMLAQDMEGKVFLLQEKKHVSMQNSETFSSGRRISVQKSANSASSKKRNDCK